MRPSLRSTLSCCLLWFAVACAAPDAREDATTSTPQLRCTWSDQVRVEMWGDVVGGPLELDAAKAACEAMGPRCAGITSEWYLEFPFMLISGETPVRDGGDYGIHYRMTCRSD